MTFLSNLAHVVLPSIAVLYMGYRYDWERSAVGLLLAGVGVCSMIVQGVLVGPVVARLGERRTLLVGLVVRRGRASRSRRWRRPARSTPSAWCVMSLWGIDGPGAAGR